MDHTEIKYHPLHDHFVQCCFKVCLFPRCKTNIKDARKRSYIIEYIPMIPLLQRTVIRSADRYQRADDNINDG